MKLQINVKQTRATSAGDINSPNLLVILRSHLDSFSYRIIVLSHACIYMYTWDIYAFIRTFVYMCIFTYVVFSHINIVYHPYVFTLHCGLICLDYSARCLIIHIMYLSVLVEHMLGQLSVSV